MYKTGTTNNLLLCSPDPKLILNPERDMILILRMILILLILSLLGDELPLRILLLQVLILILI